MRTLALVTARGGSKGLPRKNVLPLAGHPLIAWSIAAGLRASAVHRVVCSTDDPEIAEIARSYGADVPFLRPPELGRDDTRDLPVFQHSLKWLADNEGYQPDVVVHLRPTSPVRLPGWIDDMIERATEQVDSVRTVTESPLTPFKMWVLGDGGRLTPLLASPAGIAEPYNSPRQQLPVVHWQTGTIDVLRPAVTIDRESMSGERIVGYPIPQHLAIDIDTQESFERAGALVRSIECVRP